MSESRPTDMSETYKPMDGSDLRAHAENSDAEWLLDSINSPEELKRCSLAQLPQVCGEVREFLLKTVQETGGHLGSNLGVVELATALHYVFDLKRDRVVWDVSHQAYPHKIFTGRRGRFGTLRRTGGLCGFTHPEESEYDLFHTGHAGTSISLGLGLAIGTAHEPDPPHVISVIGDASLGAGVAFEALNFAGASGQRLLTVLNDNEWSISKSVGSLAKYLSRIRSARVFQRAHQELHNLVASIPLIGRKVDRTLEDMLEVARHAMIPGHVFEELGVTYIGPIDGHDVKALVETLERIRDLDGAVLLHILTEKGKGHPKAPTHPERVHGVSAAKKASTGGHKTANSESAKVRAAQAQPPAVTGPAFTKAFADGLIKLAEGDLRVHALTAGMPSGTGLTEFAERYPARFHDTGITEQHNLAMAAGMAKAGLRPVAAIYSTFLQRGFDQTFQEIALQGLPVILAMDRAGLVGQDGPTHHGVFDIAILRTLPGMTLCAPRDASDMHRMLKMALSLPSPVALRYPRDNCPVNERIHVSERRPMRPGLAEVVREAPGLDGSGGSGGAQLALWVYGALVGEALEVADRLARCGIELTVVDARFAKPIDAELLGQHAQAYRYIVTLEEHQRAGGFGSAVLETVSRLPGARAQVKVLGIPDRFVEHMTTRAEQLSACGLDADAVERVVRNLLQPSLV